jgi:hypothetical protein
MIVGRSDKCGENEHMVHTIYKYHTKTPRNIVVGRDPTSRGVG